MKLYLATTIAVLMPFGMITSSQAQGMQLPHHTLTQDAHLYAQFGGIRIPGGQDADVDDVEPDTDAEESTETTSDFTGFSEDYSAYSDSFNGFSVDIPTEFNLTTEGQTTNWIGPVLDEGAVMIYVNAAPLPGVAPGTLQQTYYQQYENDRFYTDVQKVTVPYGDGMVPAIRAKEVDTQQGTNTPKGPDDLHRWHLIVFGNDRVYTWGFTGMFQTFQDNEVQDVYETVINSVELISITE